jgi:hypothetical protein
MSEPLGRIEKPEAEGFRRGKKLYLVPLMYLSEEAPEEYKEKHSRYWRQVAEQLHNLASKVGNVSRVYHESLVQAGEEGLKAAERLNPASYQIAKSQCDHGAIFEPLEEKESFYLEAGKRRNEAVAKKIGETLKDDEAGLLFIREGHSVQFPPEIEVFSVFPPALDEIHRWHRDQARLGMEKPAEKSQEKTEEEAAEVKRKTRRRTKRKPER